jgi:fibronectin-binding autotransporter adhesin
MKTQSHFNPWTRLSLAASIVLGFSLEAHAANATWTGTAADGVWNESANWGGSTSPGITAVTGTTDVATFSTGGATVTSLGQNISLGEIITGTAGNNVSITDASHSLTFSGATAIAMNGGNLTLNTGVTFNNTAAVTVGGATLTFGGATSFGSKQVTFSGSGSSVIFNGAVAATSGTVVNQGLGMFANNNISVGNIKFGASTAAKTGNFTINTSGVTVSSAISLVTQTSGAGTSNFTIGLNVTGGGTGTYSGGLSIANGTSGIDNIIVSSAAGNTMFYTGAITGTNTSAALAIQGGGTVNLSGANTYKDGTSVSGNSTLEFANTTAMSATSTVTIAGGSTLAVSVGSGAGQFSASSSQTNGTLGGIFSGFGGQAGSVDALQANSNVGIDTGSGAVTYTGTIVNAAGTLGLTKLGTGALTLSSGSSTYSGTTTVSAGTLVLGNGSGTVSTTAANNTNGSATGTGPLVVSPGATLAGMGTAAVSSFSISGTSAVNKALVLVGQTSVSDTNTTGALTLLGGTAAGNSTITNATLNFNLDQSTVGSGNTLNVGATGISFGTNVTLALNVQNGGVIPANSTYVLIAGTGTTTITGGVTSGQYGGLNVFLNAQGLEQVLASSNGQSGNLALALSGQAATWYGNGSYLYLNDSAGVDDIDVEVVPEPGTWAMMLGGLAVLILWQRRKGKA